MKQALLLTLLLLVPACASSRLSFAPQRTGPGALATPGAWTQGDLIDLFAHLREAERAREPESALQALHFQSREDQRFYVQELYWLTGVPAGPVCAPSELHLVAGPPGHGAGDYLFLEPVQGRYQATFVTIVDVGGRPRILYRRPDVTEEERQKLKGQDLVLTAVQRRAAWWRSLDGRALAEETARLKRMLDYQSQAERYAAEQGLDLLPFAPAPAALLAELAPLSPEQVRARVLGML